MTFEWECRGLDKDPCEIKAKERGIEMTEKLFDVYFTIESPAVLLVEAESKEVATEFAMRLLEQDLTRAEILERVENALAFNPKFKIHKTKALN